MGSVASLFGGPSCENASEFQRFSDEQVFLRILLKLLFILALESFARKLQKLFPAVHYEYFTSAKVHNLYKPACHEPGISTETMGCVTEKFKNGNFKASFISVLTQTMGHMTVCCVKEVAFEHTHTDFPQE